VLLAVPATSEGAETAEVDLLNLSIEDLMQVEVTTVSQARAADLEGAGRDHRDHERGHPPLGHDERPGPASDGPGLSVANIDSSTWAITARGFNGQFANKLLVMIDGRSVYTPLFSGVYWDVQDLLLEDIDRIEVVRGPGGTLWGANAVNGVINIITKEAAQTQGLLVSGLGGNLDRSGWMRYGGQISESVHYRAYAKYLDRDDFDDRGGIRAHDGWDVARGGFRADWQATGSIA
jgi:iron complex outermembrane receptor protein